MKQIQKYILLLMVIISLVSCEEDERKIKYREIDFVIIDKIPLRNGQGYNDYFLKSKDTVLQVSTKYYAQYNVGDTIPIQIPINGFFRGTVFFK